MTPASPSSSGRLERTKSPVAVVRYHYDELVGRIIIDSADALSGAPYDMSKERKGYLYEEPERLNPGKS